MSFESNGLDRVCSLWKISNRLQGTNFCTSLSRFALSFVTQPNCPKCTQIVRNTPKYEVRVQWGGSGGFVAKSDTTSWHELLQHFSPFCTEFCKATKRYQMHPNSMKRTKTWVQVPMGSIRCARCENLWRDFVARTFAPVWPVLHWVL